MTATEKQIDDLPVLNAFPLGSEVVASVPKTGSSGPSVLKLVTASSIASVDSVVAASATANSAAAAAAAAQATANAATAQAASAGIAAQNAQATANTANGTATTAQTLAGAAQSTAANALPTAGGVMSGQIVQSLAPTAANHLANKGYVDTAVAGVSGGGGGVTFSSTPPVINGTASPGVATTSARSDHVHPVDTSRYAASNPLNYQTGTQVTNTVNTAIAGVTGVTLSSTLPVIDGTATIGTSTAAARADHIHPVDTSRYAANNPSGFQTASQVTTTVNTAIATVSPVNFSNSPPLVDGTAASGTASIASRSDHVHPTDSTRYAASNPAGYQTAAQVASAITASGGTGGGNVVISNTYIASGAIATSDLYSLFNSGSALAMTLSNGAGSRPPLFFKNIGAGTVTITTNVDGGGGSVVIPSKGAATLVWATGITSYLIISQYDPGYTLASLATATLNGAQNILVVETDSTPKKTTLSAIGTFLGTGGGGVAASSVSLAGFPTTGTNGTSLNLAAAIVTFVPSGAVGYAALVGPSGEVGSRTAFNGATPPPKTPVAAGSHTYQVFADFTGGSPLATSPTITVT